jgi:predicted PurR-regulated permease PerM
VLPPSQGVLHPTPRERAGLLILVWAGALLVALTPFVTGLLGALVLYVVFVRPNAWLARKFSSGVAASLTIILALLIVALALAWLVGLTMEQAPDALNRLRDGAFIAQIAQLHIGPVQVGAEVAKASGAISSWVSAGLFTFAGSAASVALNLIIAFAGVYYMLSSRGQWAVFRTYIPFSAQTADTLRDRFVSVTQAMLFGTVLVAVVQGTIVGVGFAIVGLPNPLFWGMIAVLASMVPLLGSTLVWGPGVLVLLSQGQTQSAIVLLVIGGGVAGNIDNIIRPLIYRRAGNLHPMITLVGAFVGLRWLGVLGLLFGPLSIAYLFELLHFYREEYEPPAPVAVAPSPVAAVTAPPITASA